MKRIVITFGVISGILSVIFMACTVYLVFIAHRVGYDQGIIVGYTGIVLSFLLVYPGIRSYRENIGNGTISFGRAFVVGILITLISCFLYVLMWELFYFIFMPEFHDKMINYMMEQVRNSGHSAGEIATELDSIKTFSEQYRNPFLNAAYTFLEPFPVGLLVTLISSLILRRKSKRPAIGEVVTTAV